MKFPNVLQTVLMLDRPFDGLEGIARSFLRIEEARSGFTFNVPEAVKGKFYRLFGGDELMITLEYVDVPANMDVFRGALSSAYTGMVTPDIRERLVRSPAHIIIELYHGVSGKAEENPRVAELMKKIGRPQEGHSLPQFTRRLDVLALLSRIACEEASVSAVHWTQSDQLMMAEMFDNFAAAPAPGPLHIHPWLFSPDKGATMGIRTFGARHFIGREILIEPNPVSWVENYQVIDRFLNIATMENGYIIPDGDSFGPESGDVSYSVTWRDEREGDDVPFYILRPLFHRESGYQAPGYLGPDNAIDDRKFPPEVMPESQEEKQALVNEWRESRKMAERSGGRFEVRSPVANAPRPPEEPDNNGAGGPVRRVVFGRKGL